MTMNFVSDDWHESTEGSTTIKSMLFIKGTNRRMPFALLERPLLSPNVSSEEYSYKIFVSGKSGVGKTSTVANLAGYPLPKTYCETPGIQTSLVFWPAKILAGSNKVVLFRLQFWDAGENSLKKFDHVLKACKSNVDAIMFMFSFTDKSSFDDLPQHMSRLSESTDNYCKFVVGTKIDQAIMEVTQRQLQEFQKLWNIPVFSTRNVPETNSGNKLDIGDIAPLLNKICDQLWQRDQLLVKRT